MAHLARVLRDRTETSTPIKQRTKETAKPNPKSMYYLRTLEHVGLNHVYMHTWVVSALLQTDILCGLQFNAITMCLWPSIGCFWRVHVVSLTEFKKTEANAMSSEKLLKGRTVFWIPHPELQQVVTHTASIYFSSPKKEYLGFFFLLLWSHN